MILNISMEKLSLDYSIKKWLFLSKYDTMKKGDKDE